MLGDHIEKHELSIRKNQHGRLIPCVGIHALYPSHEMDLREIMSWNSIVGILLPKGILKFGPLSMRSDGGIRSYRNPHIPGFRLHWDPSESIMGRIGWRIV